MLVAVIAAKPLLGSLDEAFQYIQEFTGFFTPGILFIFLSALFWKRATAASALFAAITSLVLSIAFKTLMPEVPFIDRMGLVFVLSGLVAVAEVMISGNKIHPKAVDLQTINFKTSKAFNVNTLVIVLILIAFYTIWW